MHRLARTRLTEAEAVVVLAAWADHLARPSVARKDMAVLVHLSCGQPGPALILLNNMQRVDLAALLLEAAAGCGLLEQAEHRGLYLSFARFLQGAGLGDLAALVCRDRAGERVEALAD